MQTANSLQEQILRLYVQLLYVEEAVKVNAQILDISRQNADRGAEMYKVGSLSKADLSQLDAQVATDEYNLVNMKGQFEDYKQQLKYLLRLDYDADFDIAVPSSTDGQALAEVPSASTFIEKALASRPEIRNAMLGINRSDVSLDIACGRPHANHRHYRRHRYEHRDWCRPGMGRPDEGQPRGNNRRHGERAGI